VTKPPDPAFEALLEHVRGVRGFDYTGYKRPSLMRRFQKRMDAVGAASYDEYRDVLERDAREFDELFNTILINVTSFFRDPPTWEFVRDELIPKLLDARPSGAIRVWSAGCASGEEAYTLAMLLADAIGEDAFRDRVKIYATDVDDEALQEARQALYTAKQVDAVPDELRARYFTHSNGRYQFRNDIRRSVIFGRNDLLRDPPISRVDLLVSRNTLMYFGPEAQQRIVANFYFALARRGYLIVGKAEALRAAPTCSSRTTCAAASSSRTSAPSSCRAGSCARVSTPTRRSRPPRTRRRRTRPCARRRSSRRPSRRSSSAAPARSSRSTRPRARSSASASRTSGGRCATSRCPTGRSSCAR
jgi:chemotaxis methyl-accepting protein methylase